MEITSLKHRPWRTTSCVFGLNLFNAVPRTCIFGDLRSSHGFSLCSAFSAGTEVCNRTTCAADTSAGLVSEIGKADLFIHLGDFAYDLRCNNGTTGDQFMRNIAWVIGGDFPSAVEWGESQSSYLQLPFHFLDTARSSMRCGLSSARTDHSIEQKHVKERLLMLTPATAPFSWDSGLVPYVSFCLA